MYNIRPLMSIFGQFAPFQCPPFKGGMIWGANFVFPSHFFDRNPELKSQKDLNYSLINSVLTCFYPLLSASPFGIFERERERERERDVMY